CDTKPSDRLIVQRKLLDTATPSLRNDLDILLRKVYREVMHDVERAQRKLGPGQSTIRAFRLEDLQQRLECPQTEIPLLPVRLPRAIRPTQAVVSRVRIRTAYDAQPLQPSRPTLPAANTSSTRKGNCKEE